MKVTKVELMIIDHDELGEDEIASVLTNSRYPNHCIMPMVQSMRTIDIGEWRDDHPLNITATSSEAYAKLFYGVEDTQ